MVGSGDGVSNNPINLRVQWQNFLQDWNSTCLSLGSIFPLMDITLHQIGPMPGLMQPFQSLFPNNVLGGGYDQFQLNYAPYSGAIGVSDGSKVKDDKKPAEPPKNPDGTEMTPEQQLAAKKEEVEKKAEIRGLVKKYNDLLGVLTNYKNSIADDTEKFAFESLISEYKTKSYSTSMTKEQLEADIAKLKLIYNDSDYTEKIKTWAKQDVKLTSKENADLKKTVETLYTAIVGTGSNDSILDESEDLKSDIDVMELLSTFNQNAPLCSVKSSLMSMLRSYYQTASGAKKSNLNAIAKALHNALVKKADAILKDKDLPEAKKTEITNTLRAVKDFPEDNRLVEAQTYDHAFENLYRLLRLAEAEIAEAKLSKKLECLGDENPFAGNNAGYTNEVMADLRAEGLGSARTVNDRTVLTENEVIEEIASKNKDDLAALAKYHEDYSQQAIKDAVADKFVEFAKKDIDTCIDMITNYKTIFTKQRARTVVTSTEAKDMFANANVDNSKVKTIVDYVFGGDVYFSNLEEMNKNGWIKYTDANSDGKYGASDTDNYTYLDDTPITVTNEGDGKPLKFS